ncbi:MAG TPA: S8 family peptidase [Clostridia bacterium]|jgi:serine protease AprX|nr:S8 family peptidase [Clostridia bacterium]
MDIHELRWIRTFSNKLDPALKDSLFDHYRRSKRIPCFLQRIYRFFQYRLCRLPIIIQLAPTRSYEKIKNLQDQFRKHQKLTIINSLSTTLSLQKLRKITPHPLIKKIYLDHEISTLLHQAVPITNVPTLWDNNLSGKGITLAILDTGLAPHPDFFLPQKRLLAFRDFVNQISTPYDDNGHGTHCTGLAAGNGYLSEGKYKGPAYQAQIVSLKILNKMGLGKISTAITALEWVLDNQKIYKIKIVSLSFGYKPTLTYQEDPLCQALEKIWQAGIVVCTAAGNGGPEKGSITSPGFHPDFITTGSLDNLTTVSEFSGRGPTRDGLPKPDFLLPGNNLMSTHAQGSLLDKKLPSPTKWYTALSGTSMTTPLCAGIIALLLENNPTLTPTKIKAKLLQNCHPLNAIDIYTQGQGYLDCSQI